MMSASNKISRVVHIGKHMVELSGLRDIWVGADHLCRSRMTLFYLDKPVQEITYDYGKWADCDKDVKILKNAQKEFKLS